jgi:prepilin-type N-terminal cleavage/methylation domain-containing protein
MMKRPRSDAGFTLVELLLAIAILGVVIGPLAGGIIVGLRTMDQTSNRYSASNDAQVLARYLPPDVLSANTGIVNGMSTCTGTGNRKLQLTSNTNGTGSRTIMYWVRGPVGGRYELVRSEWANGVGCTSAQPMRTTVMARNIASPSNVAATQLMGTPLGFKIAVTEAPAQNEPTGYTFTVTGRKRTTVS